MYFLEYSNTGMPIRLLSKADEVDVRSLLSSGFLVLTQEQYEAIRSNPASFLSLRVLNPCGEEGPPSLSRVESLVAQPKDTSEGFRMQQVFDAEVADLVFDNGTVFLQKAVRSARVNILTADGKQHSSLAIDLPMACELPIGAQVFCLEGHLQTYFVTQG